MFKKLGSVLSIRFLDVRKHKGYCYRYGSFFILELPSFITGTTSVVVLAGSLLEAADKLLQKGIHPTSISDSFQKAAAKSVDILTSMAIPLDLNDRESLLKSANTSLNSKVVSQNSAELSPIAVDSVLRIIDPARDNNVNLKDIKIVKKLGGTVDDTALVEGLVLEQRASNVNGPKRVEKAKIGFIQFQVSPPKTDMDNQVNMNNTGIPTKDDTSETIVWNENFLISRIPYNCKFISFFVQSLKMF